MGIEIQATVHVHVHKDGREVSQKLDLVARTIREGFMQILERVQAMEGQMARTQEVINELKAEIGPMRDAVQAMSLAFDAVLNQVEEAKDDPDELTEILAAWRQNKTDILAQAARGAVLPPTPAEPLPGGGVAG